MKFAGNLSTLCSDIPKLTERFVHLATRKDFAFNHLECQNPYGTPLEEWQALSSQYSIHWTLINTPPLFDSWKGTSILPSFEEYKENGLDQALKYVNGLNVEKLHLVLMDGSVNDKSLCDLLTKVSEECKPSRVTCVLEPLSTRPNYYLRLYDKALEIVQKVNRPNIKVMLDTFHLQMLHGNMTSYLEKLKKHEVIGHVQVSQAPLRDSPNNPGEINYHYIFKKLSKVYDGFIGLEYNSTTKDSFTWLQDYEDVTSEK